MILNQKGEVTSVTILFFILLFGAVVLYGYSKILIVNKVQNRLKFTLCIKEYNEATKQVIRRIGKGNKLIKLIVVGETATIAATGGSATAAKAATKYAKKLLKLKQTVHHFSYMKNIATLQRKKCPLPITSNITLYKLKNEGLFEQRNLRRKEWKVVFLQKGNNGILKYSLEDQLSQGPQVKSYL